MRGTVKLLLYIASIQLFSFHANATFVPPDQIRSDYSSYGAEDANMTKQEFDDMIKVAQDYYEPIVQSHGGRLNISGRWDDDTPNARASQFFFFWNVEMFGGLARHPKMTKDGFMMVICHELGHHLAGFPFVPGGGGFLPTWAANEGQSDYFAAHSCAPNLWGDEKSINASFKGQIHKIAEEGCDAAWGK